MPYSKDPIAVERVKPYLKLLYETTENKIGWTVADPKRFQYYLHCGLYAAQFIDEYKELGNLKNEWKIRLKSGIVYAERRISKETINASLSFTVDLDLYGIIEILTVNKESEIPLRFTSVTLSNDDLEKLTKWCETFNFVYDFSKGELNVSRA